MNKKSPCKPMNSNPSKSKKSTSKEREKKKLQFMGDASSSSSSSSSVEKMQLINFFDSDKRYTGFGPETIQCVADQFIGEILPDDVSTNLAEDITSKVRELLEAASINMRQGKRKHLKVDDVNATFKKYNLERIYGPSPPNWITFGDPDNLSCIPEPSVDLLELANSEQTLQEPGDIGVDYKWLNDTSLFNQLLVNNSLNNYYEKIMTSAVSNKKSLRTLALKDVAKNMNIGPIIPHLCNFCFLILQKNITYSSLATPTLQFLEAIMFNPCTSYSVDDKQMTLLIYLLLENVMNATNDMLDEVIPICRTLGRLCIQWMRGAQIVLEKLNKYLSVDEPIRRLSAPVICALSYIGHEALDAVLWPYIDAMFKCLRQMETMETLQLNAAILGAASLMYKQEERNINVDRALNMEYGDMLTPIWRWEGGVKKEGDETEAAEDSVQANWFNIKKSLLKTLKVHSQQQISHRSPQFKLYFRKAKPLVSTSISVIGYKEIAVKDRVLPVLEDPATSRIGVENVNVVTGRRTLFTLKRTFAINKKRCNKNIRDMLYMI